MNGVGAGNVKVTNEAGATVTALHSATGAGVTGATNPGGIKAVSSGTGTITVITAASDGVHAASDVDAGSSGIAAKNTSTSINSSYHSTITVTAAGTIEFGTIVNNQNGNLPAGIVASYGGNGGGTNQDLPNLLVNGDITVTNFANITLANGSSGTGDGIRASNYGVGGVTVTDEPSTRIKATGGLSLEYGIDAENYEWGNINVTTLTGTQPSTGADINTGSAGGSGIRALNLATTTSTHQSSISVTAHGTIETGTAADATFGALGGPRGSSQAIWAPARPALPAVQSSVLGDVSVDNFANITASTGYGIEVLNYGTGYGTTGAITVHNEAGAQSSPGRSASMRSPRYRPIPSPSPTTAPSRATARRAESLRSSKLAAKPAATPTSPIPATIEVDQRCDRARHIRNRRHHYHHQQRYYHRQSEHRC